MSDHLTAEQRHINMAHIRSLDTKSERTFRHALWRRGLRYRCNEKNLPGKPDIVLPKYRTAVLVHGCFWHGHEHCIKYTIPKTNTEFWTAKVARNKERDQEVWRKLEADGWYVIIVWECELTKAKLEDTVNRVETEIRRNGEALQAAKNERRKARAAYQKEQRERKEREAFYKSSLHHHQSN